VPCRLTTRRYHLPFQRTVRTAHGPWAAREGLLVRLEDETGSVGYGEVAPLPGFGTETLAEAEDTLATLGGEFEPAALGRVDEGRGCVRFALSSARAGAGAPPASASRLAVAALLPPGRDALAAADRAVASGWVAFKWKVGVLAPADEWGLLDDLFARLPRHAKMRLDANGAWTVREARRWLERCAERPVEFVEQPCFADAAEGADRRRRADDALRGLARDYPTPIALDESVTGMASLRSWLERGWPGVCVVKPALAGDSREVLSLLEKHRADAVFSSALETAVGRQAALRTALSYSGPVSRALGFGVTPLFADPRLDGPPAAPFVTAADVAQMNPEAAWNALS
jgi:O-succinylbenzoate synthase